MGPNAWANGVSSNLNIAQVNSPASVYLMFDSGTFGLDAFRALRWQTVDYEYIPGAGTATGTTCVDGYSPSPSLASDCQTGRHFGGANVAFADGHVKWLRASQMIAEASKFVGPPPGNVTVACAWNPFSTAN